MVALLKAAKAALNDDFFGLAGRAFKPGTLHYMFEIGLQCETLELLIAHCQRFVGLLIDDLSIELLRQQDVAVLRIGLHRPALDPDHWLIDQLLLYWHRVLSWSVGYRCDF
ncbi:MAG: hypothetical protein JWP96_2486 [Polaromonas sp.]|nr:hypothetical protein [Polaromonas sp.]